MVDGTKKAAQDAASYEIGCRTRSNESGLNLLLVSRTEAARMLGVSIGTVDNLRRRGELASLKLGTRCMIRIEDLNRLVLGVKAVAS